jgi:hypothetical protein
MKQIENDFIRLWFDDGIVYGEYKPNVVIDLDAAKIIVADRISLSSGTDYPQLSYIDGLSSVTKEARDFFSKDDGIKHMKRLALITTSPISRIVGNFWLQISRPAVPTRLFASKEDAITWLREV